MYYVLITDKNGNENRLKAKNWNEVLLFVRMHRGKIKEFKFKRKWQNGGKIMLWYPQLGNIYKLMKMEKEEITEEELTRYYEIKTETYEKPKRKRFYKNYISRRNLWVQIPFRTKMKWLS